jgi:hypothetical protein
MFGAGLLLIFRRYYSVYVHRIVRIRIQQLVYVMGLCRLAASRIEMAVNLLETCSG